MATSHVVKLPAIVPTQIEGMLRHPVGLSGHTGWLWKNAHLDREKGEVNRHVWHIAEHGGFAAPKDERAAIRGGGCAVTWAVDDHVAWGWLLKGVFRTVEDDGAVSHWAPNAAGSMVVVGIRPEQSGRSTHLFSFDRSAELGVAGATIRYRLEQIMSSWNGSGVPDISTAAFFATFCDQVKIDVETLVTSLHSNGLVLPVSLEVTGSREDARFVRRMQYVAESALFEVFHWDTLKYDVAPFDAKPYFPKTDMQIHELRQSALAKLSREECEALGLEAA